MTLESRKQLSGLPRVPARGLDAADSASGPAQVEEAEKHVLALRPPRDGTLYSINEVAEMMNVPASTVRSWRCKGADRVDGGGGKVYLVCLRVPRSRINPKDLCAFLSAVNGCEVVVEDA